MIKKHMNNQAQSSESGSNGTLLERLGNGYFGLRPIFSANVLFGIILGVLVGLSYDRSINRTLLEGSFWGIVLAFAIFCEWRLLPLMSGLGWPWSWGILIAGAMTALAFCIPIVGVGVFCLILRSAARTQMSLLGIRLESGLSREEFDAQVAQISSPSCSNSLTRG